MCLGLSVGTPSTAMNRDPGPLSRHVHCRSAGAALSKTLFVLCDAHRASTRPTTCHALRASQSTKQVLDGTGDQAARWSRT